MANTFELISSATVGSGGAATVDFTSIPATYTDLVLKLSMRTNAGNAQGDWIKMYFNSNSTGYVARLLIGNGTAASSFTATGWGWAAQQNSTSQTANTFGNGEIYIPNYAGSANKSFSSDSVSETNATSPEMELAAGIWSNTAAITSISLSSGNGGTIQQYSTAYLYGVKNA